MSDQDQSGNTQGSHDDDYAQNSAPPQQLTSSQPQAEGPHLMDAHRSQQEIQQLPPDTGIDPRLLRGPSANLTNFSLQAGSQGMMDPRSYSMGPPQRPLQATGDKLGQGLTFAENTSNAAVGSQQHFPPSPYRLDSVSITHPAPPVRVAPLPSKAASSLQIQALEFPVCEPHPVPVLRRTLAAILSGVKTLKNQRQTKI